MRKIVVALSLALLTLPPVVHAHILKLLDGRILKGELVSATGDTLYFHVEGDTIQSFPIDKILSLHFSSATINAAPTVAEPLKIPAGTTVRVKISDELGTKTSDAGQRFFATMAQDLAVDGVTLSAGGKRVFGRVRKVVKPKRSNDRAVIEIVLSDLTIAGRTQPIVTDYFGVEHDGDGNYQLLGTATPLDATLGIFTDDRNVRIPAGTVLEFHVAHPVSVRGVFR
ncbi:MAG: hypothetical protein PVF33_01695 [Candidatus Latescibacterota bacterium]|jgi:hypothetical protein